MKITPDSSLFTALTRLPSPAEVRRRAVPPENSGGQAVDPARREKDARDAIVRQALRDAAQRQAALRKGQQQTNQSRAAAQTSVRASASTEAAPAAGAEPAATTRGSVTREAPFADGRPQFVRLGQFIDITV